MPPTDFQLQPRSRTKHYPHSQSLSHLRRGTFKGYCMITERAVKDDRTREN
ncbi:hypothetical protein [Limnospira fusiformis]|uniref:hypothetical protein n=1 Tax=Limnospira fusiformis TaxID=54297 RepID=UPI000305FF23|nr:hypothetical protein HFV01_25670 [Limnospira fusiformis SAG 85.79]